MTRALDLVTFGETMLRLSPPGFQRLVQTQTMEANVGGSELSTAVAAQRLGLTTAYVTRLPSNALGRIVVNKAREHGVDTSHVIWADGDRIGLYFVEFGASPRRNSVLYDRRDSAFSRLQPGEVDWPDILQSARVFHTSGITPALSSTAEAATKEAIHAAKESGITVSIDLNYRARLWSREAAARTMSGLLEEADILITTEEDTERVFGIEAGDYERASKVLAERFGLEAVAITLRKTPSVWRNTWSGIVYADGEIYHGPSYDIEVVDRVGSGDSFGGGFLYGYLTDGPQAGADYGVAISALKQTNPGDCCWASREEVEHLLGGESLRIDR